MKKQSWNIFWCRIIALLFLIMLVRYRAISMLIRDPSGDILTTIIVVLFYVLNIGSLLGLFFVKSWGFITTYFSIPLSTFLFAVSYVPLLTDWFPPKARMYTVPALNALLLIAIVSLQAQLRRF